MKKIILQLQIATIFIGSIVGAGVCSGRELNQFFATYGLSGFVGIVICGMMYSILGKIIIGITAFSNVKSYNEFVELVCPKIIAKFINFILTLFLLSSTSIILAGSGAIIAEYFGISRWIGFLGMIGISSVFLLRKTAGLFEVNSIVVPTLIIMMSAVFFTYVMKHPEQITYRYLLMMPRQKTHILLSTIVYVSFNILTIIGVIVPLTTEIKQAQEIAKGIRLGSIILTVVSLYITFLMLVNPFYPKLYEIPLLAVAMRMGKWLQAGVLGVMWLEMFSSQVSNVYSLSYFLTSKFKINYHLGIFLVVIIAAPFSLIGFSKLVEFLYPLYGVLSLIFLICCILFYRKHKVGIEKAYAKK